MSLINQMLRDLEARNTNQPANPPGAHTPLGINPAPPTPATHRLLYATAALLLLSAGTGAGWYLAKGSDTSAPQTAVATHSERIAAPPLPAAVVQLPTGLRPNLRRDSLPSPVAASPTVATAPPFAPTRAAATPQSAPPTAEVTPFAEKDTPRAPVHPPALHREPAPAANPENTARAAITRTSDPSAELTRILNQARQRYRRQDYPGVISLLQPHLHGENISQPQSAGATPDPKTELRARLYQHMALAQLGLQQLAAASATLARGHLVAPADVELHMLYARVLLEQDEVDAAYTLLRQLPQPQLAAKPDFYALRAALARHNGAYAEAAELYTLLCQLQPFRGDWRLGLGISQHQLGALEQARATYLLAAANTQLDENLRAYAAQQAQLLTP